MTLICYPKQWFFFALVSLSLANDVRLYMELYINTHHDDVANSACIVHWALITIQSGSARVIAEGVLGWQTVLYLVHSDTFDGIVCAWCALASPDANESSEIAKRSTKYPIRGFERTKSNETNGTKSLMLSQ